MKKTKIITTQSIVIESCSKCLYHYEELQPFPHRWIFRTLVSNHFCTACFYHIEDADAMNLPVCYPPNNKTETYVYIKDIDNIPNTCPLEDYS
jgi:hypothetical protein